MAVREQTVGADAGATVQAEDVLLILLHTLVYHTRVKELLPKKNFKPVRNNLQTPRKQPNQQTILKHQLHDIIQNQKHPNKEHTIFFFSTTRETT